MIKTFRFATFNAGLTRPQSGALITDLSTPHHPQAKNVAEIIQRVNPDVLVLQELDYDGTKTALQLFQDHYLSVSQNGAVSTYFPYRYAIPTNTGIPSRMDLDKDGRTDSPGDALGFGFHPGQYAFAVLAKYPLRWKQIRTFQRFLWKDMPQAKLPINPPTGESWYSAEQLNILRLSSKNHVDVPIALPGGTVHLLVAHPAPPVFDGQEQRHKLRNFDEIRLWADYISPDQNNYLYDDKGQFGGLSDPDFVIMGDLNADPQDGESINQAINQLLHHPRIQTQPIPSSLGGKEQAQLNPAGYQNHRGDPAYHTASWGLRVDYVLPASCLKVHASGIFWPTTSAPLHYLVAKRGEVEASSDHRLVWVDLALS
ncbi:MAG: endonuclease/exonuclease/phosphatase family protein [Thioploca sp.]|nr:endonuclease/exonuclease/phosphatase family protein [Thioploca sp.]